MIITAQIANKSGFDIVGNHVQVYIKPKTPQKNMRAANACAARIRSKGVRKVLYSKEFPYREIFASHGLFPYSEMNLLRAVAAQAAVAALASLERPAERASVCLAAERYMPQLENAAVRLYPLVKNIFFCLPRGGEELCAAMLSGYGVAAQNFTANRVKRASSYILCRISQTCGNTVFQFICRLVCKGNSHNFPRHCRIYG